MMKGNSVGAEHVGSIEHPNRSDGILQSDREPFESFDHRVMVGHFLVSCLFPI